MNADTSDYNLERFKEAQDACYHRVKAELSRSRKLTHWIWYIFPQVSGLGRSSTAEHYAIKSKAEAVAYSQDTLLAGRLIECAKILLASDEKDISKIMGFPDDLKLRSSMTLFSHISNEPVFEQVIQKYYQGQEDQATLDIINQW